MKRAIQQTRELSGKFLGPDEIKVSRFFRGAVLKSGWLFFLFFLLLNTPSIFGQSVEVSPNRLPPGGTRCAGLSIRNGDRLTGTTTHYAGPGGGRVPNISHTRVYANSVLVYSDDLNIDDYGNPGSRNIDIPPVNYTKVDVCISAEDYDSNDIAKVTLRIAPRSNLTALLPIVQPNGDLIYGYRVGNRAWDPRTNYVPVELFYYNQTTKKYTLIAAHGMRLEANATESFPIGAAEVPTVPAGTTHLAVRIDKNDVIPESDEDDNVQLFPLPKSNLIVTSLAYDSANRITIGYEFNSVMPVIPPNIQLKLNYATGTRFSDIVRDYPALKEVELSSQDLPRNKSRQITLNAGEYLLPTSEATQLLASIDMPDDRFPEDSDSDNIKTAPVQIAPGYTRLTIGRGSGVAVYQKGNYFVTVVDLSKATLASSLNREAAYFGQLGYHFNRGLRGNTSRRSLKVVVNGAIFRQDLPINLQTEYTYGLKHNGRLINPGASSPVSGRTDIHVVAFSFDRSSASITINKHALLNDRRYRNVVGTVSTPNPPTTEPNTKNVVGLRDQIGNGIYGEVRYRTLLIFSTRQTTTFQQVVNELNLFGTQRTAQLDSGASTSLIAAKGNRGTSLLRSIRPIPHALLVFGGQQHPRPAQLSIDSSAVSYDATLPVSFNIVAIKKNNTQSNRTELSVLSGEGEFANIFNQLPTGFHPTEDNFQFLLSDWDLDGYTDLFGIKKQFTGAGKTEVHILSGATGYSKFVFQTATGLHETDGQWKFALADWDGDRRPDLFCIRRSGGASGRVEVHVLSAASNYQKFILNTPTAFQYAGDNFDFHIADWDGDARPDLIAIKKNQTGAGRTEIHIASGASSFGNFILQTGTVLHETDSTWSFAVTDWDGGGRVDLVGFKKLNTGTNSTEIHVVQGENQFQNFALQIGTALPNTGQETELLLADNAAVGDYDPLAKRYAYTEDGIYLFRNDEILKYTGQAPAGWQTIDRNSAISAVASTSDGFFQLQSPSGSIFRYDSTNNSWQPVSTDSNNIAIAATSESLYALQRSGAVLKYTGTGWTLISQDSLTRAIVATDDALFQMHSTGRILRLDGNSWVTVSTSYSTKQIVATPDEIFAVRNGGEVFVYTGSDWQMIGNDANTISISTDGETIYRQLANGQAFRYYGQPMSGWKLVGWP